MPLNRKAKLKEIYDLFAQAETAIEKVENISTVLSTPAVNELRYAGRHLLNALHQNNAKAEESLRKAENHCQRSIYDAWKSGTVFFQDVFRQFNIDYATIDKTNVLSDYASRRAQANKTHEWLYNIVDKDRHKYFQEIKTHFDEMREITLYLGEARDILNTVITKENEEKVEQYKKEQTDRAELNNHRTTQNILKITGLILTLCALIVGAWISLKQPCNDGQACQTIKSETITDK